MQSDYLHQCIKTAVLPKKTRGKVRRGKAKGKDTKMRRKMEKFMKQGHFDTFI